MNHSTVPKIESNELVGLFQAKCILNLNRPTMCLP